MDSTIREDFKQLVLSVTQEDPKERPELPVAVKKLQCVLETVLSASDDRMIHKAKKQKIECACAVHESV